MFNDYFKKRKKRNKEIKIKKAYINGYDFAAGMLLRKEKSIDELESYYYDGLDHFDIGMADAIKRLDFILERNI